MTDVQLDTMTSARTSYSAAVAAVDLGLSVVLAEVAPGEVTEKKPLNLRAFGPGGAHAHTRDPDEIRSWLRACAAAGRMINAGVAVGQPLPGGGTLAVVDMDTPHARQGFAELCAEHGQAMPEVTTTSPGGLRAETLAWEHWDGAHLWIRIPDGALPDTLPGTVNVTPSASAATSAEVKLRDSWVMMPPSQRREGPYSWGPSPAILDAPEWLISVIASKAPAPKPVRLEPLPENPARESWEQTTAWSDILIPAGYSPTERGSLAACGCSKWDRPGSSNPGSVVAHEACAAHGDWLHLNTDNRDDDCILRAADELQRANLNKVEAAAAVRFEHYAENIGDKIRRLMDAEGMRSRSSEIGDLAATFNRMNSRTTRPAEVAPKHDATGMPIAFG